MSIIFIKEIEEQQGYRVLEPMVDYNRETGQIYIPRYNTRDLLKAHKEGEARGYLSQGMKMAYIPYPIYQELQEHLSVLLNKLSAIQQEMLDLNQAYFKEAHIPLWSFLENNQGLLTGAGAKLMLLDNGEVRVITDKDYVALQGDSDADDDELEEPEDISGDEDIEDDVEDEEPEENPKEPHKIRIILQYPEEDD